MALSRREVVTLQQNNQVLVLDFAAVYHCAIKPFKDKAQNRTVCILLLGDVDDKAKKLPMSDAVCSNYINGKRAVPDNYRDQLAELTVDELERRLNRIGIHEYEYVAESLSHLVENVAMTKSQRNRLLSLYREGDPLTFINSVFRAASDTKSPKALTPTDITWLGSMTAIPEEYPAAPSSPVSEPDSEPEQQEDIEWMRDYVPPKIPINVESFFGTPIKASRQVLSMPKDFSALVHLLKPALTGFPVDTFQFEDFVENMAINPASGKVKSGSLCSWKLIGPVEGIIGAIVGLNMSDVSDAAFIMRGRATVPDSKLIEKSIRQASNKNVTLLKALAFDSRLTDLEVTLILHIDAEKAKVQRNNIVELDEDGVRIGRPTRWNQG